MPFSLSAKDSLHTPICPKCRHDILKIAVRSTIQTEVVFDHVAGELIVIGETLEDSDWDEQNVVHCPKCDWQGRVADIKLGER